MTDNETIQAIKILLEPINQKLDNIELRQINFDLRLANLEQQVKRGFKRNDQDIETLRAVLEARDMLPKAK